MYDSPIFRVVIIVVMIYMMYNGFFGVPKGRAYFNGFSAEHAPPRAQTVPTEKTPHPFESSKSSEQGSSPSP